MTTVRYCYYCGNTATSAEHVPPKAIFPEAKDTGGIDYRKNLMTVPSCDKHNTAKSNDDEYLLLILALHAFKNDAGQRQFDSKTRRLVHMKPKFVMQTIRKMVPVTVKTPAGDIRGISQAFFVDQKRYKRILNHISRALWFHEFQERFTGTLRITINGLSGSVLRPNDQVRIRAQAELRQNLLLQGLKGDNPDIFQYAFHENQPYGKILAMFFYGFFMVVLEMAP